MRGVNRVTLIGNLGKDPEVQYLEGNIPVSKFPLATTETYKDKRKIFQLPDRRIPREILCERKDGKRYLAKPI